MIKFLIVEDHTIVAEGLSDMLQKAYPSCSISLAGDGASAIQFLVENTDTQIILLDINLPDSNGIEICKEIKNRWPSMSIIALSSFHQPGIINKMLENGAVSYLMKNTSAKSLFLAIEKVSEGRSYIPPEINEILKHNPDQFLLNTPVITKREKEVLKLIAEGMTNQNIADALFISQLTAISHRKSLLQKTGAKNTAQLIRYAIEFGII
ncbi:MAG: response regulator transcription factor [Flavobacteriaceae bacterium]|nr:response regulator transcription factor [Flavobacteriaceae bacterium]